MHFIYMFNFEMCQIYEHFVTCQIFKYFVILTKKGGHIENAIRNISISCVDSWIKLNYGV